MMNEFQIATTGYFDTVECDFYSRDDEMYMTINQLARALEYADRKGVEKLIERNPYLTESEFSVTDKLSATDGKRYTTRLFTEDGIYEISMLSDMPKARIFRAWVRKLIKAYRRGALAIPDARIMVMLESQNKRIAALESTIAGSIEPIKDKPSTPQLTDPAACFIRAINEALQEKYFLYRKHSRVQFDESKLLGTYDRDFYYIISARAYNLYTCKEENSVPRQALYAYLRSMNLLRLNTYQKNLGNTTQSISIMRKDYNCLVFHSDKAPIQAPMRVY